MGPTLSHRCTMKQSSGLVPTMLGKFDLGNSRRVSDIVTGVETWIYMLDPETKQQSSQWLRKVAPPPLKFRRSRSCQKKMVTTFQVASPSTVTADWYTNTCLPKVVEKFQEKRPKTGCRGIQFHHVNAPAHKTRITVSFMESNGFNLLGHPVQP